MIRVYRGNEPSGFDQRATDWRLRYELAKKRDPNLTPSEFWSKVRREIRGDADKLFIASHGKCAFCESKITHVFAPHIEHYRPKGKFPDLMFAWGNWLLSCGRCNERKWSHFPYCADEPCLIDPAGEDPSQHLSFIGCQVFASTTRGNQTIKLLGLDRSPLDQERAWWLLKIKILLLLMWRVPEASEEARLLLRWAVQPNAPYAAMTRAYLQHKTQHLMGTDAGIVSYNPDEQLDRITQLVEYYSEELQQLSYLDG